MQEKEVIIKTLKLFPLCFQKSGKYRIELKNLLKEYKISKTKLVMTLLVKDEEDIIETNIRFHYAMGVDRFIVTVHNSSDRTLDILKNLKNDIPLEIIELKSDGYFQDIWVDKMIRLARDKYKADWVINADADEFYYSRDFDLKKSILKYTAGNVIILPSICPYPDDREDYLSCPYFITNFMPEYLAKDLNIDINLPENSHFLIESSCKKVIHNTKDYIKIKMGNHGVQMRRKKVIPSEDIKLYHFTVRNYTYYVKKAKNYLESSKLMPGANGEHVKKMIEELQNGTLREYYNKRYNPEKLALLLENGVVTKDYSLINFLRHFNIIH